MKIVTNSPAVATPVNRRAGQVTEKEGEFFLCVDRRGYSLPYIVNLASKAVAEATGRQLIPGERLCAAAAFYPDGLPVQPVAPLPPPTPRNVHAAQFALWYWGNLVESGASNITRYEVLEIVEGRTNANCRRAFAAWLAARGV